MWLLRISNESTLAVLLSGDVLLLIISFGLNENADDKSIST